MKHLRSLILFGLLSAAPLLGAVSVVKMAVKRGQTTVDPRVLPLACITLVLDHAALPLSEITFVDLETHDEIVAKLRSQDATHPNVLTAMQGEHRSLTMAILHLKPGRYKLKDIEFEGRKRTAFRLYLKDKEGYCFRVEPGCINFVGSLVAVAEWGKIGDPSPYFATGVSVEQTQDRDQKWAADVVPGLAGFRSVPSKFEFE